MKWFFALALLCTLLGAVPAAPAKPKAVKAKAAKVGKNATVSKVVATRSSRQMAAARGAGGHRFAASSISGRHAVPTLRAGNRHVVTRRVMVHGRWVKVTRVVHTVPAVVLQQHPETDRYQEIQKALADRGYFKGEPNGQWGDDSVDALKRFQADQKLDMDGKINSRSLIGLGLGPKHDGSSGAPISSAPVTTPDIPDSVPAPKYVNQSANAPPQ